MKSYKFSTKFSRNSPKKKNFNNSEISEFSGYLKSSTIKTLWNPVSNAMHKVFTELRNTTQYGLYFDQ
jgi:hypothetical protein